MKDKDEQTALIGMAIGAAVISLVATQMPARGAAPAIC